MVIIDTATVVNVVSVAVAADNARLRVWVTLSVVVDVLEIAFTATGVVLGDSADIAIVTIFIAFFDDIIVNMAIGVAIVTMYVLSKAVRVMIATKSFVFTDTDGVLVGRVGIIAVVFLIVVVTEINVLVLVIMVSVFRLFIVFCIFIAVLIVISCCTGILWTIPGDRNLVGELLSRFWRFLSF